MARMADGSTADVAVRAFVVAAVSTLAATGVATLLVGGWAGLAADATDVVLLLAFPLLVAGSCAALRHLTRRRGWWAGRERRWVFAGVVTAASLLVTCVVSVVLGVVFAITDPPADGADPHVVSAAFVLWVFVSLLTGLPVWTLLFGVLVGPGGPPRDEALREGPSARDR